MMYTKKEKTREHILEVSYPLFAKNGFDRVTMKDICEAAELSRGGLYSHFPGTKEIFEAILEKLNLKEEMNFQKEMNQGISAVQILENALSLMEEEMNHPKDSLSLAMYEYAGSIETDLMDYFNRIGEEKWTALIYYGIERDEFRSVDVKEIVNVILYSYQGMRMWSRIVSVTSENMKAITSHIRKQLLKET